MYYKSQEIFPKTLSKEEFTELFVKFKDGEEEAINQLILHNMRLVTSEVTNRFKTFNYDKEDLISIGKVGLLKALNTFDLSKNYAFSSYAIRCIDNEILMFIKKLSKEKNVYSLDNIIYEGKDGNTLTFESTIKDDRDDIEEFIHKDELESLIMLVEELPELERKIIKMHFGFYNGKRYTQSEMANELDIAQGNLSRMISKTADKLRLRLNRIDRIGINKMKSLENDTACKNDKKKRKAKKARTIYEYFNNYSKGEINRVISNLSDEEKRLLTLRYGEDLEAPTKTQISASEYTKFYTKLAPKMSELLLSHRQKMEAIRSEFLAMKLESKEAEKREKGKVLIKQ